MPWNKIMRKLRVTNVASFFLERFYNTHTHWLSMCNRIIIEARLDGTSGKDFGEKSEVEDVGLGKGWLSLENVRKKC